MVHIDWILSFQFFINFFIFFFPFFFGFKSTFYFFDFKSTFDMIYQQVIYGRVQMLRNHSNLACGFSSTMIPSFLFHFPSSLLFYFWSYKFLMISNNHFFNRHEMTKIPSPWKFALGVVLYSYSSLVIARREKMRESLKYPQSEPLRLCM